jgi:hypothetical protein
LVSMTTLSKPRKQLLRVMQRVNFGRIENLVVCRGEPVLEPSPRVVKDLKLGGDNEPRPELELQHFELKREQTELFDALTRIQDGQVELIEIKHGLPFRLTVVEMI